jgi:hypothetical protein
MIQFPPDDLMDHLVRQLPGAQWSQTLKGWHIGNNPENLRLIFKTFKGKASIDKSGIFGPESLKVVSKETKEISLIFPQERLALLSEKYPGKLMNLFCG